MNDRNWLLPLRFVLSPIAEPFFQRFARTNKGSIGQTPKCCQLQKGNTMKNMLLSMLAVVTMSGCWLGGGGYDQCERNDYLSPSMDAMRDQRESVYRNQVESRQRYQQQETETRLNNLENSQRMQQNRSTYTPARSTYQPTPSRTYPPKDTGLRTGSYTGSGLNTGQRR